MDELLFPPNGLIHGVFTPKDDIFANFRTRCSNKGVDFHRFSKNWHSRGPPFNPYDPEVAVVLDASLGTLQETFDFAWEWLADGQESGYREGTLLSDSKHLRLLSDDRPPDAEGDGPDFQPWTLRWVRIKLDANYQKTPNAVRDPKTSAGCALLFMGAEHPARIKAIGDGKRCGFWLAGLKCPSRLITDYFFPNVPYIGRRDSQVQLGSLDRWLPIRNMSVPTLLKPPDLRTWSGRHGDMP